MVGHMNDDTSSLPGRELTRILYGPDSVFARTPKLDQVLCASTVSPRFHTLESEDAYVAVAIHTPGLYVPAMYTSCENSPPAALVLHSCMMVQQHCQERAVAPADPS